MASHLGAECRRGSVGSIDFTKIQFGEEWPWSRKTRRPINKGKAYYYRIIEQAAEKEGSLVRQL